MANVSPVHLHVSSLLLYQARYCLIREHCRKLVWIFHCVASITYHSFRLWMLSLFGKNPQYKELIVEARVRGRGVSSRWECEYSGPDDGIDPCRRDIGR